MRVRVVQALSRKNAIWVGLGALALVFALLALASASAGMPGDRANTSLAAQLVRYAANVPGASQVGRKLSDLLNRRSPGERVKGVLVKTKTKARAAAPRRHVRQRALGKRAPSQRALGKIVVPPEVFPPTEFALNTAPLGLTPYESLGPYDFGTGVGPSPLVAPSGPGGVLIVPPGDVGGGVPPGDGGGGVTTPPTPTPPVAAVPEPSTWAMMLAGFGFIGFALRRRPRTRSAGRARWSAL